jgi:hypothetical protein
MPSSGMLSCMALVRTDVLEECITSFVRVTEIGELGTLAVTRNQSMLQCMYCIFLYSMIRLLVTANVHSSPILVTLMVKVICSSELSVLTRATLRNIPEDSILQHSSAFFKFTYNDYLCSLFWRYILCILYYMDLSCVSIVKKGLYHYVLNVTFLNSSFIGYYTSRCFHEDWVWCAFLSLKVTYLLVDGFNVLIHNQVPKKNTVFRDVKL